MPLLSYLFAQSNSHYSMATNGLIQGFVQVLRELATILTVTILLTPITCQGIDDKPCVIETGAATARATSTTSGGGYRTHSCTPCSRGSFEVHVLNVYEPLGGTRAFQQKPTTVGTIDVTITSLDTERGVIVNLLLVSYEAVLWRITVGERVHLTQIRLGSYYTSATNVTLVPPREIPVIKDSVTFTAWEEPDTTEMTQYVKRHFGFLTSFTGRYEADNWALEVGGCPDDESTPPSVRDCLLSPNCLVKIRFRYDDTWNACHGDQYVTMYKEHYVGIILCSERRYKFFISDSLEGEFLNIADSSGHGEDHCEFVGGSEQDSTLSNDYSSSPNTKGFYRSNGGDKIRYGDIGGVPEWTGKFYSKWYQCNIAIPGPKAVLQFNTIFTPDGASSARPTDAGPQSSAGPAPGTPPVGNTPNGDGNAPVLSNTVILVAVIVVPIVCVVGIIVIVICVVVYINKRTTTASRTMSGGPGNLPMAETQKDDIYYEIPHTYEEIPDRDGYVRSSVPVPPRPDVLGMNDHLRTHRPKPYETLGYMEPTSEAPYIDIIPPPTP